MLLESSYLMLQFEIKTCIYITKISRFNKEDAHGLEKDYRLR
jgi:hypothetical protein